MYKPEEKTLILGALFHDIGKFEQRCAGSNLGKPHWQLGAEFVESGQFKHHFEEILGKDNFPLFVQIIKEHHKNNSSDLANIVKEADHLSASERVKMEENEEITLKWNHKHLCSLFSKINLLSDEKTQNAYYKHSVINKNFDVIIPQELTDKEINQSDFKYNQEHFNCFKNDLQSILELNKKDEDFDSLINLLLLLFEKYLWCIPDFTGSEETDISLYNHLKDVAAFSHAIYQSKDKKTLNLIIGDIPGIQAYIFNVVHKKPAKILRGRSIYIQILTRIFANKLLKELGLTEANLIMHAGGKIYILAGDNDEFKHKFNNVVGEIEKYLFDEFGAELGFNTAYCAFNYEKLKTKKITFGQLIEEVSFNLNENKNKLFGKILFNKQLNNFTFREEYISAEGETDNIKCKVTDRPIPEKHKDEITDEFEENGKIKSEKIQVTKQVKCEYEIGSRLTGNNVLIILDEVNNMKINPDKIFKIKEYKKSEEDEKKIKILLNPNLDKLLKKENLNKKIYQNTRFLEVANYCSYDKNKKIMPFEDMAKENDGAEILTLIKGDIDNLGLIMAYGLAEDKNDLTAVSRTTTLSYHLKYYFSFFLNGFLEEWEKEGEKKEKNDHRVYTIFAGGDDLMLVTPQSSATELIDKFMEYFNKFTCHNPEAHISFSVTHFKDHTPIRIVADLAEENQKEGKKINKKIWKEMLKKDTSPDPKTFYKENNKAGTYIFDTLIKNENLTYFNKITAQISEWVTDDSVKFTKGVLRKLFYISEALSKFSKDKNPSHLIWLARLNYTVNRLLKEKDGTIKNKNIEDFINSVLKNENNKVHSMLLAITSQSIYKLRN